ncbi:3-oxoacyl-ACP reductase FabG [Nodosilinea sp. P-1105]|uniref:3-oxoacyl-ACP reductase FabG n=1 Tax=Nodosilinea sp. P-1105 TaxID=2546229 RepID=UPI00146A005B|nr:3-oxoacyl-ACP reductase FabG [Nodosilinea sp. P-1105]NMF86667.1 3-oxoacyl-ACP reductase FabG [Nodosilinea sp. P-1105]
MDGNQILITGGAGGLGTAVTQTALERGATVVVPYRKDTDRDRLQSTLPAASLERLRLVRADLLDEATVISLIHDIPRLDGLIHLVGGFSMGDTADFAYRDWKQAFDLNVNTTFLVCKHGLKKMQAQNYGRIVTVGSRGAVEPSAQLAAYCAAKAAVVALTKSIAAETQGTNITANVVLPSVIDTPANRDAMGTENVDQWVTPESLAEVICFLASAAARDVRGAAIPVYGNV